KLCGREIHIPSLVKKAFKYKLVLQNWPHKDIAIPGFNCDLSNLNTPALRSIAQPRIDFIKKTVENTLEPDDLCLQHVRVELWDEDINGETLVKAEASESWQTELLSLDEDEVNTQKEAEGKKATEAARAGKGKGKATGPVKVALVSKSMPLWVDEEDEGSDFATPSPQPEAAAPTRRAQPVSRTQRILPHPVAPTFRTMADVHDEYMKLPCPHNTHLNIADEFATYQEAQRTRAARAAEDLERHDAAWAKFHRDMEEYNARGWSDFTSVEPPTKKRKLDVDEAEVR
ncbi:hypothetical protein V5O48_017774, partial [Marasmius crinis-equi]